MDNSSRSLTSVPTRFAHLKPHIWLSLYALTLASAVLFFGGAFPLAQALLPFFCALLLIFTLNPTRPAPFLVIGTLFAPVALCLIWAILQLMPIGMENGYWHLVENGTGTISLTPWKTLHHIILGFGYLAFAWSTYQAGRIIPTKVLIISVISIALACTYGLYTTSSGAESVLWLPKTAYQGYLTGTFINKNSFATLAALGVITSLALVMLRVGEISSRLTLTQRFKAFWLLVLVPGWPWLLVAGICFMALVLTGSRAGLAAGAVGVLVLLGSLAGTRRAARWPLALILGALSLLFLIVLAAVGQSVGVRMTRLQSDGELRDMIYNLTHRLITENWITGTGFGSFQQAFSTMRDDTMLRRLPALIEYAHNTYLELATELGLPGIILLTSATFALLATLLHGAITRRRAVIWPTLGLATVVVAGGHALADFSLSVPAVALVTLSFVMLGVAQSFPEKSESPQPTARWQRVSSLAVRVSAVALLCVSAWLSVAEYHAFKAEGAIRTMQSGIALRPTEIFPVQRHLQECLAIRPGHTACREGLAQSYLSLATAYGLTGQQRGVALVYLNMAELNYTEALRQSPANPWAWYRLARIQAFLGDTKQASVSLANSLLTGPYEPRLAVNRVPFMFSLMPHASADDAALFGINAAAVWQAQKKQTEVIIKKNPAVWPMFATMLQAQQAPLPRWLKLP